MVDNGQGIPQEAIPDLFTKFFRVTGPLEQGSKGTGLGLYISKLIINMHKGKIWVESELGKGSKFTFSLPIASQNIIKKYDQKNKNSKDGSLLGGDKPGIIINKSRIEKLKNHNIST